MSLPKQTTEELVQIVDQKLLSNDWEGFGESLREMLKSLAADPGKIPKAGGKLFDLSNLFMRVMSFGGYVKTTENRLWK